MADPVAGTATFTTTGAPVNFAWPCTDADGDPLTFSVGTVSPTGCGVVTNNGDGTGTFVPTGTCPAGTNVSISFSCCDEPCGTCAERHTEPRAWDTAWEMAYKATNAEIVQYLDHLEAVCFDGPWFLILPFGGGINLFKPAFGDNIADYAGNGAPITLTPAYINRILFILDECEKRCLKAGMVTAWARPNVCLNNGNGVQNVNPSNAFAYGQHLGNLFGNHPGLEHFILGGDKPSNTGDPNNQCPDSLHRQVAQLQHDGWTSTGAGNLSPFHTGPGSPINDYMLFHNEPWLDMQAIQSGHCQNAGQLSIKLGQSQGIASKPLILAESRYYRINPPWPGCLHELGVGAPVSAADIAADVNAALANNFYGAVFGDVLRYQWDVNDPGNVADPAYNPGSIAGTFNSPGEQAFLAAIGR